MGRSPLRREQDRRRREHMLLNGPRESFTIEEIGDRDGWVCQICLDPVDPAFQAPDPRSPSADHIRAITLGGTHTRANVRITHLFCNMDRNDHSDEPRGTVVIKGRHGDAIEITTLDRGDIDKPRRRRLVLKDERGNVVSDHTYMVTPRTPEQARERLALRVHALHEQRPGARPQLPGAVMNRSAAEIVPPARLTPTSGC